MKAGATIAMSVVLIREEVDHPWEDHRWRVAGLLPLQGTNSSEDDWRELSRGPGWVQYAAGIHPLELFRKETAAYQVNLDNRVPVIYAVLRETEIGGDDEPRIIVHLITASPFEAQDYLDSGEEIVESLPMADYLIEWVASFVEEHHEEEKFVKRQKDMVDVKDHKFGQEPIFVTRNRMNGRGGET